MSEKSHAGGWLLAVAIALAVVAYVTQDRWSHLWSDDAPGGDRPHPTAVAHSHSGHDHAHHGHGAEASIELSQRGLRNIGFEPFEIRLGDYTRRLSVPAVVIDIPGRSEVHITAPLTGVVEEIYVAQGEAVEPDQLLFRMRLTHEELVTVQREYLETRASLEVAERELARLKGLDPGVVADKRILDQEYQRDRLQVALDAARQGMLLHGLTEEQVEQVRDSGQMFQETLVRAPQHTDIGEACEAPHLLTVQSLGVALGEHVELGRELALLTDHCELQIEALSFEDDAAAIRHAAERELGVTARTLGQPSLDSQLTDLEIIYVAGRIDVESRAFKVYVRLPNRIALEKTNSRGKKFLEWAYKPGQRMELGIPVETWQDQLVVPTTAVVEEGAEAYVYRQNGDHFDQVPVHVRYRDQRAVVIANDGALFPGDVIAGNGAYQMHLALKNKSGGAIDPHAGHNH